MKKLLSIVVLMFSFIVIALLTLMLTQCSQSAARPRRRT